MSPEQLKKLQQLSQLFEEGIAGPEQLKQLSELLANVNNFDDTIDPSQQVNVKQPYQGIK